MTRKTAAVVVTWNRKELLRRCLTALLNQTAAIEKIIVVNNACTDGTAEMLQADFPMVMVVHMEHNSGGAGGFHEGIRTASELKMDLIWLMDDDAWATPEALEELIKANDAIHPSPSFVCSRVMDSDGEGVNLPGRLAVRPETKWDQYLASGYLPVEACTFVSVLIPNLFVERVGLPLSHYFIWLDDAEYTIRLSKIVPGWFVATSIVNHPRPIGLKLANLRLEDNPARLPFYRHYYANTFETHFRHLDVFGRRWVHGYFNNVLLDALFFVRHWRIDRLRIMLDGVRLGVWRSFKLALAKKR